MAVDSALDLWRDQKLWRRIVHSGMSRDFGWANSAKKYVELYERARKL
jgi:starch synthase